MNSRAALALRNQKMATTFHATPIKHRVRRVLLTAAAHLPVRHRRSGHTNRILLIRPDHLGDVLLTTPAIHALRAARPDSEIHALVGPWSAEVLARYPEVDQVLTLPFPGFYRTGPKTSLRSPYEMALHSARQLRLVGYDSAVILRPDHWWGAMLAFFAGIPERIGYRLPDVRPFLTDSVEHRPEHAVIQNLRLVERWTGILDEKSCSYYFPLDLLDTAYVDGFLQEWGIRPNQPIICIHPGSGTWVKRWREDRWAAVADTLSEQLEATVVFSGGDHELSLVKSIRAQMKQNACLMVGNTQVGQLAALYARARVVLGCDSGPLHLAASVGAPTVTLFGPADPVEFGPWGARNKHMVLTSDIDCRPCRVLDWGTDNPECHPCVRDITLGQVLEAARRVVQQQAD